LEILYYPGGFASIANFVMDPLSIAAGVLSIVRSAIKAAESIAKIMKTVRNANRTIQDFLNGISGLTALCRQIGNLAKQHRVSDSEKEERRTMEDVVENADTLSRIIQDIEKLLRTEISSLVSITPRHRLVKTYRFAGLADILHRRGRNIRKYRAFNTASNIQLESTTNKMRVCRGNNVSILEDRGFHTGNKESWISGTSRPPRSLCGGTIFDTSSPFDVDADVDTSKLYMIADGGRHSKQLVWTSHICTCLEEIQVLTW
jgi:Fungal N-terminal domain of STAND proteins